LLIPEYQIFKDKALTKLVTDIFNVLQEKMMKDKNHSYNYIQLQSDWCHLGVALQRADLLINDRNINEALVLANKVWLRIKENGIENKLKEECRNTISQALQGLEQFEEGDEFNKQNISCHGNSIRTHKIAMRNSVHNKRFDIVKMKQVKQINISHNSKDQKKEILWEACFVIK
jgi:hypothetical protein